MSARKRRNARSKYIVPFTKCAFGFDASQSIQVVLFGSMGFSLISHVFQLDPAKALRFPEVA